MRSVMDANVRLRSVAFAVALLLLNGCASTAPEPAGTSVPSGLARMSAVNKEPVDVAEKVARLHAIDEDVYAPLSGSIPAQSTSMLGDMFDASHLMVFYAPFTDRRLALHHVSRMRDIHDVLEERSTATDAQAMALFGAYVAIRDFRAAKHLAERRPALRTIALPTLHTDPSFDASLPAILSPKPDGAFVATNVTLAQGPRIIAVVGCEVSAEMVAAIARDPALAAQLRDAGVSWVAPADNWLDAAIVQQWNARFPAQPMVVAYENTAWAPVDLSTMPGVFFFRDGALVASVDGWDPDATLVALRKALAAF